MTAGAVNGDAIGPGRLEVGVLADDLTGAMASAARLGRVGARPRIVWDEGPDLDGHDAVVVDMRTRDGDAAAAAERARAWAGRLRHWGCRTFELRMDSLLRGSPAAELRGLLDGAELGGAPQVALSAFPEAGRTTVGGVQMAVDGSGGERELGEVGPAVFGGQDFEVIGIELLETGVDEVAARLGRSDVRRFVVDATADEHLRVAGQALGLAFRPGAPAVTLSPGAWLRHHPALGRDGFTLVVVGSATEANRAQLEHLGRSRPGALASLPATGGGEAPVADRSLTVFVVETLSAEPGTGDLAAAAADAAMRVIEGAVEQGRTCRGIVASGGRTAEHVMDRLGARSLARVAEVDALCSEVEVVGGPAEGMPVCAKGGSVGDLDTFERLVRRIEGGRT